MGLLLEASNITHFIRDRKLIATEALRIHKGDRIGLVGKNGSGKTTLLHILAQKITAETGKITLYGTIELVPQLKQMNTTKSGGEVTQAYINNALLVTPISY